MHRARVVCMILKFVRAVIWGLNARALIYCTNFEYYNILYTRFNFHFNPEPRDCDGIYNVYRLSSSLIIP